MKKNSGWFTALLLAAAVAAAFTVPSKERLEQQLAAAYTGSVHVNINETKVKLIFPLASICSYTITGLPKQVNLQGMEGKPISFATLLKTGVYVGLFGRFWKWN